MKKLMTRIVFAALLVLTCTSTTMLSTNSFGGGSIPVPPDCYPCIAK